MGALQQVRQREVPVFQVVQQLAQNTQPDATREESMMAATTNTTSGNMLLA